MRFFGSGNGGSSASTAAGKLPTVPLPPEGEAALKKLMPKETPGKS